MTTGPTCDCGQPKPEAQLQCSACARAAFKKLAKMAVAAGVILGLICSSLPHDYQAPCKALASLLASC